MKPAPIRLIVRLFSAFMLGVIACHLICGNPQTSSGDSNMAVEAKKSRLHGENISDRNEPMPNSSSSSHTHLQPTPDPGPGTKGFDPWANIEPGGLAMHCDGTICKTSVTQRQIIPSRGKQPKEAGMDGPTLAFPTVLPPTPRGHLIEVGVEFLSEVKP